MNPLPEEPNLAQRALMDRARREAERDAEKPPRRLLPQVVALVLSVTIVGIVGLGFDRFLTSVQKVLHVMQEQDRAEEARKAREPMPAYSVQPEPAPTGAADTAPPPDQRRP